MIESGNGLVTFWGSGNECPGSGWFGSDMRTFLDDVGLMIGRAHS